MRNKACMTVVQQALSKVNGIDRKTVWIDLSSRTVTVTYDSLKLSLKNIEFAIAEIGFQANEVPAKPEAAKALPPECRKP